MLRRTNEMMVCCDFLSRFIFCRAVLSAFCPPEESEQYVPVCLPQLPNSLSPKAEVVQSSVSQLSNHLNVADGFHFDNT